jgi:hypothetical protein
LTAVSLGVRIGYPPFGREVTIRRGHRRGARQKQLCASSVPKNRVRTAHFGPLS